MDTGELDDYEEAFDNNKETVEQHLKKFESQSNKIEQSKHLKIMDKALQELDENAKAYKQKIFEMPKSEEKNLLDRHQNYVKMIKGLKDQVAEKRKEYNAASASDEDDIIKTNGRIDYNKNTSQQVIQHGHIVQDRSKKVGERLVQRVDEANKMGQKHIEELERQEEVILQIQDVNEEIDSDLKRAKKYLKYFARTYMQDKLIMVLIFLWVCAIIGILVVSVIKDK